MNSARRALRLAALEDRLTPAATPLPIDVTTAAALWRGVANTVTNNNNDFQPPGFADPGFGLTDAAILNPTHDDPYDGAFELAVNGVRFVNPTDSVDLTGTTVTSGTQTLSGLDVQAQFYFDANTATIRAIYSFSNNTSATIPAGVVWGNNLGSDSDTRIETTSGGDATLDATDRWLITSDGFPDADPVITWVRFGTGTTLRPTATLRTPGKAADGLDWYAEQFDLSVAPGQTQRLMLFGQLHQPQAVAAAAADAHALFDGNVALRNSGLMSGVSTAERAEIVNWQFGPEGSGAFADVTDAKLDATSVGTYTLAVTFTDSDNVAVGSIGGNEIRVTGPNGFSTLAAVKSVAPAADAASVTATFTFTPPGGKWDSGDNGDYTVTFVSGTVSNVPEGVNYEQRLGTFNVSLHAPSVTVEQAATQADPTADATVRFTVTFSEPVFDFDAADVALGGTAGASKVEVVGNPGDATYELRVSGMTKNGTVSAAVNAGGAKDLSGDANLASTSVDNTVTYTGKTVHIFATGAGSGGGPHVKVFNADGSLRSEFFAYAPEFTGGVRVAVADVDGDGTDDVITGAGPGGGPHVKVFSGATGAVIKEFFAYTADFTGGVFVAAGDVNHDGQMDIVTGADMGGGPHVKAFDGNTRAEVRSFFAYDAEFHGGVRVAAGDVDGDGYADIITGAGPGGGPHVIAYSGKDRSILQSFYAFEESFASGVFVAAGDFDGDRRADIVASRGFGGDPQVKVFSGADAKVLKDFLAYDRAFQGGVRVALADLNADGLLDFVTSAGPGGFPNVQGHDGKTAELRFSFNAYIPEFTGGVYVG